MVSIICYAWNPKASHLRDLLLSLASQTCQDFTLLLIDDASDPPLREIVDGLYRAPRRWWRGRGPIVLPSWLTLVRMPERFDMLNVHMLWGYGVRHTTWDLVTCIGSDDLMWPDRLERVVAAFADDPALDVLHHNALFIDDTGGIYLQDGHPVTFVTSEPHATLYRRLCAGANVLAHPTVVMRRRIYDRIGFPEWGPCSDYHFWIRCAREGVQIRYLEECLMSYRVHPGGGSTQSPRKEEVQWQTQQMLTYWLTRRHPVGRDRTGLDPIGV